MTASTDQVQKDCDRVVREALAEPDASKRAALLLAWLTTAIASGDIIADEAVRKVLGL
jgi:hypothetical protein